METTSTFEWDAIIGTPDRKAAAESRYFREQADRARKEEKLCRCRQNEKRKKSLEARAVRHALISLTAATVTYMFTRAGVVWMAWVSFSVSILFALCSAYGAGRSYQITRK